MWRVICMAMQWSVLQYPRDSYISPFLASKEQQHRQNYGEVLLHSLSRTSPSLTIYAHTARWNLRRIEKKSRWSHVSQRLSKEPVSKGPKLKLINTLKVRIAAQSAIPKKIIVNLRDVWSWNESALPCTGMLGSAWGWCMYCSYLWRKFRTCCCCGFDFRESRAIKFRKEIEKNLEFSWLPWTLYKQQSSA